MNENKTKMTHQSVIEYLQSVENEKRRIDSFRLLDIFEEILDLDPVMWGDKIIGYGTYNYKTKAGREGEWMLTGFSPGKQHLTLYMMSGFSPVQELLDKLGKYKIGKSCLYINRLEDVDLEVLKDLITESVIAVKNNEISYE
jgi:7,8-dihydro-6-hydroxymethylpterin-pyrophosphokinase